MHIAFVIPNLGAGGAERVICNLSKEFVSRGHEVDVIMMMNDSIQYNIYNGVRVIKLDYSKNSKIDRIIQLRNYLKRNKKAICIPFHDSCLKYALVASLGLNTKIVACERNNPYIKGNTLIKRIKASIPYLLASKCVFQTEDAMKYYLKYVKRKSKVIYNPLNNNLNEKWNYNDSKVIVSVGRLEKQKNHKILIESFSRFLEIYPEYKLNIYGEGTLRKELNEYIEFLGLGDSVALCGITNDIPKELMTSRFFVLSSDYEGMSNALLEAMAIGMPVISTDHPIGGARAIIDNGYNGLLVPVGDIDSLTEAMVNLAKDMDYSIFLGNNAYRINEKLSLYKIGEEWIEMLEHN